jgi:hypothetical protein
MAIPCFHKEITVQVLQEFGFNPKAGDLAAVANAKVDEKQGNDAEQTHLHAMRGFAAEKQGSAKQANLLSMRGSQAAGSLPGLMEDEGHCQREVQKLLDQARDAIVDAILTRHDGNGALEALGAALHTAQDKAFHHFEEWPYKGLFDALMKSCCYMIAHGLRDLGVGLEVTEPSYGHYALGLNVPLAHTDLLLGLVGKRAAVLGAGAPSNVYIGVMGFSDFGARPGGLPGPADLGFRGTGGIFTISFGRSPSTMPRLQGSPESFREAPQVDPYARIVSDGAQAWNDAKRNTSDFVQEVRKKVVYSDENGEAVWNGFIQRKFTDKSDWPLFEATLPKRKAASQGSGGPKTR